MNYRVDVYQIQAGYSIRWEYTQPVEYDGDQFPPGISSMPPVLGEERSLTLVVVAAEPETAEQVAREQIEMRRDMLGLALHQQLDSLMKPSVSRDWPQGLTREGWEKLAERREG